MIALDDQSGRAHIGYQGRFASTQTPYGIGHSDIVVFGRIATTD